MVARTPDGGEIDLLDWFAELTIYTSSACLIGTRFREQLDGRFAGLYHDLEQGTDALAYVDPYADIPSFHAPRRRPGAASSSWSRRSWTSRADEPPVPAKDDRDLLDVLMSIRNDDGSPHFSADIITGMFISMMFAGHHTTSGTAAWTLIELLRHPELPRGGASTSSTSSPPTATEVSYQALREMPQLGGGHQGGAAAAPAADPAAARGQGRPRGAGPPHPGRLAGGRVAVGVEPPARGLRRPRRASTRGRYLEPRAEDADNPWSWIPFGAGRHRCVGAAFAMMQLKAIFAVLLRQLDVELTQPHDTYRNDHSKMVVQLAQPCAARLSPRRPTVGAALTASCTPSTVMRFHRRRGSA